MANADERLTTLNRTVSPSSPLCARRPSLPWTPSTRTVPTPPGRTFRRIGRCPGCRDRADQSSGHEGLGDLSILRRSRPRLLGFTEQFSVSVDHISQDQTDALLEHASEQEVFDLRLPYTSSKWRCACHQSLKRCSLPGGLPMIGSRVSPDVMDASTLPPVYDRFAATVVRQSSVEPMVTELVRLRCAQYHDCRLCGSARLVAAVRAGLSEDMVVMLGDYESTNWCSRWKTALRLTDRDHQSDEHP